MHFFTIFIFVLSFNVSALSQKLGYFSGRVAKINQKAGLIRVYVQFKNKKYLNQKDQVEFWDERSNSAVSKSRCEATLLAKSSDYYLLRVKFMDQCLRSVILSNGAYLKFFSQDMANNLLMGKEVISILKKKYQVYFGLVGREKRQMNTFLSRMDMINKRYDLLRAKLERERRNLLHTLEDERVEIQTDLEKHKFTLYEVQKKLEQYSMNDDNFKIDRWSLDSHLYLKK